jgi:hypothetical protein
MNANSAVEPEEENKLRGSILGAKNVEAIACANAFGGRSTCELAQAAIPKGRG